MTIDGSELAAAWRRDWRQFRNQTPTQQISTEHSVPSQAASQKEDFCETQAQGKVKGRKGMVTKRSSKVNKNICPKLTLKVVATHLSCPLIKFRCMFVKFTCLCLGSFSCLLVNFVLH